MKKPLTFRSHPSEDVLENYALRRVSEEESATVEEHLLVCSECLEEIEGLDEYGRLMRSETARLMPPSQPSKLREFWNTVLTPTAWPRLAWAVPAVAVCLLAVVYIAPRRGDSLAPALITISDLRDSETPKRVPAGKPLNLQIQADGIAPSPSYRIEVSDVKGQIVWTRHLKLLDWSFEEESAPGFSKGLYRVRIYGQDRLLKEFTLRAD